MNDSINSKDVWDANSLAFLYEISCEINRFENNATPFNDLLKLITEHFGSHTAFVRLISEEGWMDLYASHGLDDRQISLLQHTPIDGYLFSNENAATRGIRFAQSDTILKGATTQMLIVPVRQQVHTLGALNILLDSADLKLNDEKVRLLLSIGQHIGHAIEKLRIEAVARQKLIQEERNMIANELHDSLAQTLASLRFQVRILDETLQPTSEYMAIMGIEQVEHGLDEAYTDLRELIAHCRVPIEQQGLIPSIERVVEKFREETGIHILLQCECQAPDVPANMEMNVYRIVQESLTNIRKHAEAHIVRVLLSCDDNGNFRVLIENDGKGFDKEAIQSTAGQHLGLTIMQERARHLGGKLKIESDLEEGTRVELKFQYQREQTA